MVRRTDPNGGSARKATSRESGSRWAVVLAGGERVRLRPLVRRMRGDERPKQFVRLLGTRTLLGQTLDRIRLLIPAERTVIVALESHTSYLADELADCPGLSVLHQPENRGTAAAVLFAAQWIEVRDPRATVLYFPSDHFIPEEAAFMTHIDEVAGFVERQPQWIVLLGAQPSGPETDYGWIEPGERVGWTDRGSIYRIRRFREKPSKEVARALFADGCLWNTFVFAGRPAALLSAVRVCAPSLYDRLARVRAFSDSEHERWAIRQAYALAPTVNFSRSVLEACSEPVAVSRMPGLIWSDLGSPDRAVNALITLGVATPWLTGVDGLAVG